MLEVSPQFLIQVCYFKWTSSCIWRFNRYLHKINENLYYALWAWDLSINLKEHNDLKKKKLPILQSWNNQNSPPPFWRSLAWDLQLPRDVWQQPNFVSMINNQIKDILAYYTWKVVLVCSRLATLGSCNWSFKDQLAIIPVHQSWSRVTRSTLVHQGWLLWHQIHMNFIIPDWRLEMIPYFEL